MQHNKQLSLRTRVQAKYRIGSQSVENKDDQNPLLVLLNVNQRLKKLSLLARVTYINFL